MSAPRSADSPHAWASPPALIGMAWVLTAATLAWTVFGTDPRGRILTGLAAAGLLLFALFGTVARPRLAVDADGVEIRRLFGRHRWTWEAVRITVSSTRRFGRTVSLLELDSADLTDEGGLVVLGWLDLGTEPAEVAAVLRSYPIRRSAGSD
jgi:hypothetical protein